MVGVQESLSGRHQQHVKDLMSQVGGIMEKVVRGSRQFLVGERNSSFKQYGDNSMNVRYLSTAAVQWIAEVGYQQTPEIIR